MLTVNHKARRAKPSVGEYSAVPTGFDADDALDDIYGASEMIELSPCRNPKQFFLSLFVLGCSWTAVAIFIWLRIWSILCMLLAANIFFIFASPWFSVDRFWMSQDTDPFNYLYDVCELDNTIKIYLTFSGIHIRGLGWDGCDIGYKYDCIVATKTQHTMATHKYHQNASQIQMIQFNVATVRVVVCPNAQRHFDNRLRIMDSKAENRLKQERILNYRSLSRTAEIEGSLGLRWQRYDSGIIEIEPKIKPMTFSFIKSGCTSTIAKIGLIMLVLFGGWFSYYPMNIATLLSCFSGSKKALVYDCDLVYQIQLRETAVINGFIRQLMQATEAHAHLHEANAVELCKQYVGDLKFSQPDECTFFHIWIQGAPELYDQSSGTVRA